MRRHLILPAGLAVLCACEPVGVPDVRESIAAISPRSGLDLGDITTSPDGRCFARMDPPTQTTIVTEQLLIIPEVRDLNGVVTSPPVFRNVTRPETTIIGEGAQFETVCPPQYTSEFVSTVQRALQVRGDYVGPINGNLDSATSAAIGAYQARNGQNTDVLSIQTARALGVIATPVFAIDG